MHFKICLITEWEGKKGEKERWKEEQTGEGRGGRGKKTHLVGSTEEFGDQPDSIHVRTQHKA